MNFRRSAAFTLAIATLMVANAAWAGNGQNLLQYVPASTSIVVNIDLTQVRELPLFQTVWGMATADSDVQETLAQLETEVGFNPNTDINTIQILVGADPETDFAVFIEGSFDQARIATFLATLPAEEMATIEYQGRTVYHDPSDTGSDRAFVTFLADGVIAIGSQTGLNAVLDTTAGGANVSTNAAVQTQLSGVDAANAFWFGGVMSPAMMTDAEGPMAGMNALRGGGSFASGLAVNYVLGINTAAEATAMAEFLNTSISEAAADQSLAAMGLGTLPEMVSVSAAAEEVTINVHVPQETIDQLMAIFGALMAAEGGF